MTHVSSYITIDLPIGSVWDAIRDFGRIGEYLAVTCAVEGEGEGAVRALTSPDGSTMVERLETLDENGRRLSYALLTDTPFRSCVMTMALRAVNGNQTELVWSATFSADGLPENEAAALLEGALAANCQALRTSLEAGPRPAF